MQVKDSSQNGKRPLLRLQVLIVAITLTAVVVVILLGSQIYRGTREMATEQFNRQQLILARSAATGIEGYCKELSAALSSLAKLPGIQQMAPECLQSMQHVYWGFPPRTSMRLLDSDGVLRFIYPFDGWRGELVGRDYGTETFFREARETGHVSVSGLIVNEQGEARIRVAVPVYLTYKSETVTVGDETGVIVTSIDPDKPEAGRFQGVLVGSFDPYIIIRDFISPIVSGETGYAWLLNEEGIFLAHHEEEFIGRSAFEIQAEQTHDISYAAIEQIQRQMMAGEEGMGRYVSGWHRERNGEIEKLVAYTPVHIDDHVWSVAVCAPVSKVEEIVQTTIRSKQYTLTFVILSLMTGGLGLFITSLRWSRSLEQETEERFRTIFENVAMGLYRTTPDGRILVANSAMARILGYSSFEELAQRDLEGEGFEPGYPRSVFKQRIESEGQIIGLESAWTRRDGTTLFVRESARAVWDDGGNILYYEGTAEDITERVRAEESLRESEARYRLLAENVTDIIWTTDMNLQFTYVTPSLARMLGYSVEEAMAKTLEEVLTPASLEVAVKAFAEEMAVEDLEREGLFRARTLELETYCKDGSIAWTEIKVTGLRDPDGRLVGIVGITRDIAERKRAEEQIKAKSLFLESLIQQSPLPTFVMDSKGFNVMVNEAFLKFYAVPNMEMILGRNALTEPANVSQGVVKYFKEALSGKIVETPEIEFVSPYKNKKTITRCRLFPIVDPTGTLTNVVVVQEDITERKRAEEALRESEGKYRLLAENTLDAIWKMDLNLEFTYINSAVFDILGFTPKEWIGTKLPEHCSPEEMQKIANIITRELENLETHTGVVFETHFYNKQGEEIACEVNSKIFFDETEKPIGLQGTTRDITERKRAEEALRKSEQRYRSLFEGLPVGLYRMTPQGLILHANPALVQMLGYPDRRALMAVNALDLYVNPEDLERQQALLEREGIVRDFETQFRRYDGTVIWVRNTVQAVRSDRRDVFYYEGSMEDITERKRAEREIEERRSYLESVLACAPDAIVTLDARHNILEWNLGAERLFGYTLQEVVGRNLDNLITGPDANVFEGATGLTRQILAGGNAPPAEVVRYRKDGSPVDVIVAGSPILIGDEVIGMVAIYTDVTERKRVERQLRQQERLAAVGQLAAGIAHDFNNTMASIILYAQMMLRASALSSRDRERLVTINQEARHAANLTQQILDFSRRSVLERRPLDLLPFLKELARLLESTLSENIKIVLAYGPDEYTVNADPTRVQQAMMNLALNARDAMPEGGELRIGLERIRIKDSQEVPLPEMEAGEWVQVTVADTGTGIPPDALPHMFEPFFTTKPVGQGTGLGLAQVYGIIKQHGGEIDMESELGHGSTFVIYLPALPVSAPEALPHEILALAEGRGETILVVEDNPSAREALSDTLEMLNYRVLAAANGREALEIYRSAEGARPATASTSTASTRGRRGGERSRRACPERSRRIDLVLTDVVMPGMGGRDLMRELRKIDPHLKGLVVTGYAVKGDLREEGIVDVLRKPFDVGALAEVVRHALDAD